MGQKLEQGNEVETGWIRAHEELSRLAKARAALDAEEGRWLLCALRSGTHLHLGFASFAEYVEHLFGYRPRSTGERAVCFMELENSTRLTPIDDKVSHRLKQSASNDR